MTDAWKPLPTSEHRELYTPRYATRAKPQPPPTVGAFDLPLVGCCINEEWMAHIAGALASLEWPDAWSGTPAEIETALAEVTRIQEVMNCQCDPQGLAIYFNSVASFRANLHILFQQGGITVVAPGLPDTFFDLDSGDVGPDILRRENALCFATLDYVNTVLDDVVAKMAGLGLFSITTFGPIVFQINPMAGALFAGAIALITAGLTTIINDPSLREEIACCMYAGLRGKAVSEANFETSLDSCGFAFGSDPEIIRELVESGLDDQLNFLAFARALGSYFAFADVAVLSCPCIVTELFCDFKIDRCAFELIIGPNGPEATYDEGLGWDNGPSGVVNHFINIDSEFDEDITFTEVRIFIEHTMSSDIGWHVFLYDVADVELLHSTIILPPEETVVRFTFPEETGVRRLRLQVVKQGLATNFAGHMTACQVWADPAPFPEQPV